MRQVDLPGLDSKFIEGHRAVLATLLDATLPPGQIETSVSGVGQFERRYGFRGKPDRVRARLPRVRSLLMDGATLLSHREAWVAEGAPHSREFKHLTASEQRLYQALCSNLYADRLRLEQEHIRYQSLQQALAGIGQARAVSCTGDVNETPS